MHKKVNTATSKHDYDSYKRIHFKTAHNPNKLQKIDNSLYNPVDELKCVCAQKSEVNEFIIFGQHIAAQLQKLPLEESLKIQADIQHVLTSARLCIMNNMSNLSKKSQESRYV